MASSIAKIQKRIEELNARLQQPAKTSAVEVQQPVSTAEEEKNKGGPLGGVGYLLEKLGTGIIRGVEGISDFVVGGVADLFGADEYAERQMKNDWINYSHADEWYNPGEGWQFVGDVASGIGEMLPSVALHAIPVAGPVLSTAAFMTSAAGRATSETVKQTGDLSGKEWLYGTASGAVEGFIEKFSGDIGGTQAGKVIGKQFGKTALGKAAISFAGEGLEEVASDLVDPALKRVTGVDKEAKVDWANLPRTFAVGGTTGAVMGGASRVLNAAKAGGFNNLNASENAQELGERLADNNVRQAKGKKLTYTQEDINVVRDRLSKNLQKMSAENRQSFIEQNNLGNLFNEDGSVKQTMPAPGTYNTDSYSASLKGQEGSFVFKPVAMDSEASTAAKKAMNALTKLTKGDVNIILTEDAITTESGAKANGLFKDGIIYLDAKADNYEQIKIVGAHEVVHSLEGTKAYNALANYVAETISKDPALQSKYGYEKYRAVYDSILEGDWTETTKDYQAMTEIFADYIANEVLVNEDSLRRVTNRDANILVKLYEWVRDSIKRLGNTESELASKRSLRKMERLLSTALNESRGGVSLETIEKNAREAERTKEQEKTAVKTTGKLAAVRASLDKQLKSLQSYTSEEINSITKNAKYKVAESYGDIVDFIEKAENKENLNQLLFIGKVNNQVASFIQQEIGVNVKGKSIALSSDDLRHIFNGHGKSSFEADRGQIAITKTNVEDIIETIIAPDKVNKEVENDGQVKVLFEKRLNGRNLAVTVLSNKKNTLTLKSARIFKNRISPSNDANTPSSTSKTLGGMNDSSTSIIRENSEKSTQNAKKVEKTSTSRSSLNVDSEGNLLTKEQVEYFKDSKVRDKDGNLLVVYHQTENDFTVFDTQREGAAQSDHETPNGIFLKPTSEDIGLKGKRQMSLYVNITNPKQFYDRDMARRHWENNIEGYSDILKKLEENDRVYGEAFENAFNSNMPRAEYLQLSEEERMRIEREAEAREDKILADWRAANSVLEKKAKGLIDAYLRKSGFDGVFLIRDAGSFGRVVQTFIALSPEQVKNITNKNPTKSGDIRYSLDLTFAEQVDAVLSGADTTNTHLKLGDKTPMLLQEAGFPDLPILMTANHLKTITADSGKNNANYHGLPLDIVKKLPEYISEPVIIADSLTRGDSVVILTEAMDSKKRPVVAAILLEGKGRIDGKHINANIMTSAYGKDNFLSFLNKIADKNAVIYWNEKKSQDLSVSLGVQFPNAITSLNSNIIIRKANAFVNSLDEKSSNRSNKRYSLDVNSPKAQREAAWTKVLGQYVHRINFSPETKKAIVKQYGKDRAAQIFHVWESTTDNGVDIATAYKELERDGFSTYAAYIEDFLMDMDSTFSRIAPKLYKAAESGKEIAGQEEQQKRKREITKTLEEVELSGRQIQQVAKYSKQKVYSKQEAEIIINNILEGYMNYEEEVGSLSGKNRKQAVQMLWEGMNKATPGQKTKIAAKVADYLIQHTVMENISRDAIVQIHSDTIEALRPYLHKLNLDNIKEDLQYHFGNNSPYLLWGKSKGEKGIGIDVAAMELAEKGYYIEAINNVDIFLHINELYQNAVKGIKQKSKRFVNEVLGEANQKELQQDLVKALLRSFDQYGSDSELTKILQTYDKRTQNWKEKYYEERDRNYHTSNVLYKVQLLKDIERGTFANASEFKNDIFKKSIGLLGRIKYRGNLNKSGTRKILGSLLEWYVPENPILSEGVYNEEVAKMLMQLADNMKPLTAEQYDLLAELEEKSGFRSFDKLKEWYTRANLGNQYSKIVKSWLSELADPTEFAVAELRSLENIVDYFKNFIENYNKVYRNGKLVEAAPLADKYIKQLQKRKRTKISWLRKLFEKYLQTFGDPMTIARYYDGYEDGFFSETLESFRAGAIAAVEMEQSLQEPLEKFYQKNKNFLKDSYDRTIEYQGEKISVQQAMLLYMTLKRDQALRGLAYSGIKIKREDSTVSIKGFASEENLDIESLRQQALQEQEVIFQQFNDIEREYIAIAEKIFNEECKKAKSETDILRQGYTNISDGYYVPIRRASIAQNIEKWTYKDELATISEFSFNKDTVAGAKNQLFIDSLTDVLTKHIGGISQYSSLALAIDSYNILFNLNISGNPNVAINVKSESENVWAEGGRYFSELIDDIKGVSKSQGSGKKFIKTLRSGYAKYQLGANPKVWVTQLSSFAAATNILNPSSLVGGFGIKVKDDVLDQYCPLAKIRNSENSAALAQGVIEKTGKIGDVLMKPIGMVDRWVIKRLFGACQIEVAKNGGPKRGTQENLTKAGELLTRVILETQQNALATERSAAMRSGNEIMKSFTMFSADSMKALGRVVDAIGETAVLRAQIRVETDPKIKEQLQKRLALANKKAVKALSALIVSALFMASVALGFKWLYNKDDKDEDVVKNLTVDAIGNLFGGLPFIRDVYSFFSDGYEVQNFAYVAFNDLLDSATIVKDLSNSLIDGNEIDRRELTLSIRKLTYASGQILGIPTRNMYNVAYGLTKRISPETAYKWNDAFYKSSYKSDLAKAIENEDDEMMATIVGLMLNENVGGIENETTRKVMDTLITSGYNIIPKAIPDKLTYMENEETVEISLTKKQKDSFAELYFKANEAAARMVKSVQFNKLSQDGQASALKLLYDAYYNLSVDNCLERESTQKNVLFMAAFDAVSLATIIVKLKSIEADKDKFGRSVSGSRKEKIIKYIESLRFSAAQKYMILGYLGYKNTKGEEKVRKYISGLNLSNKEKELLLEYSGYGN